MLPLLIVKLGDTIPDLAARRGGFETWIAAALGDAPVRVVDPRFDAHGLPDPGEISAAVVTGSRAMVTDRAAWSETTARWLARVVAAGVLRTATVPISMPSGCQSASPPRAWASN